MTVANTMAAEALLTLWGVDGSLDSRVEAYLDSLRANPQGWYASVRAEEGVAAAERQMVQWRTEHRFDEVANGISPVAEAMLALAQLRVQERDRFVYVIDRSADDGFPNFLYTSEQTRMVVIFNPIVSGCGCGQPVAADLFGRGGALDLKAITLWVDPASSGETRRSNACLSLVLPIRSNHPMASSAGFCTVQFRPSGDADADLSSAAFMPHGMFFKAIGLAPRGIWVPTQASGGDPNGLIGFPGAMDLLITNLPALAAYLGDLADKLDPKHVH